jgi:hypothetical protein
VLSIQTIQSDIDLEIVANTVSHLKGRVFREFVHQAKECTKHGVTLMESAIKIIRNRMESAEKKSLKAMKRQS